MAADLREMQENQGFSENRIDKIEFTRQKARGRRLNRPRLCEQHKKAPQSREKRIKQQTGTATQAVSVLFWFECAGGCRSRCSHQ